jgi:hypothetical protein
MKKPSKIKWLRKFKGESSTVTVSKDSSGEYFVFFFVREVIKPLKKIEYLE